MTKILVIGYGNPGRGDDGLGPALIKLVEENGLGCESGACGVTTDSDYQLNIEYAVDFAKHDKVIMIDASETGPEPFGFDRVIPSKDSRFTTHSISPGTLAALTGELTETPPDCRLLAIRGYNFDFGEGLSAEAESNMLAAYDFLESLIAELKKRTVDQ